jgi:hypothetical protein
MRTSIRAGSLGMLLVGLRVVGCGARAPDKASTSVTESALTSDFQYPWANGVTHRVTQANGFDYPPGNNGYSHICNPVGKDCYAWDFDLGVNTPVLAAKGGIAHTRWVTDAGTACWYGCGNTCPKVGTTDCTNKANVIYIQHADGSNTVYLHLWRFDVTEGQPVTTAQQIGLSGESGWTTAAHLHYMATTGYTYYSASTPSSFEGGAHPGPGAVVTSHNTNTPVCVPNCAGAAACATPDGCGHPCPCPYDNTDQYATGCMNVGATTGCTAYRSYDGYVQSRRSNNCPTVWARYTCNYAPCNGCVETVRYDPYLVGNHACYALGNGGVSYPPQITLNASGGTAYSYASPWAPNTIGCNY